MWHWHWLVSWPLRMVHMVSREEFRKDAAKGFSPTLISRGISFLLQLAKLSWLLPDSWTDFPPSPHIAALQAGAWLMWIPWFALFELLSF